MLLDNVPFDHRRCENTELYYSHVCMNDFLCCNSYIILLYILVTPKIALNCSSPTTVNQADYFACECKRTDGNPPADVTWFKDNTRIVTGKDVANLVLSNVDKDDSGTYRCVAKSHKKAKNETSFEFIVIRKYNRHSCTL